MTQVAELVAYAERLGLEAPDLDMAVHDCAQDAELDTLNSLEGEREQDEHIARVERGAAAINNGGLAIQVEYLLRHNSAEEVRRLLKDAAGPAGHGG
jgi:hypothetical protein